MSQVVRHPYMIGVREQAKFKDTYGGEPGWAFIEGMQIRPEDRESNAHGERNARNTHVPTLVVGNGADSACTPCHTHRLYEAIPHADKEIFEIEGTSHYYMGQRDELLQCIEIYSRWLRAHDLDD